MEIGYGSVSVYDSIRYSLYFDSEKNAFFTTTDGKKYVIYLNNKHVSMINQNKKLWIILSQLTPAQILDNKINIFKNPTIDIL